MNDIIVVGDRQYESTKLLRSRYGMGGRTIQRWVERGLLPQPIRVGVRQFWPRDKIEELLIRGLE
jgi:DNA-binding transcriptional MerR regulator